jgi:uncharacterized protein YodC (DUF2158 family)
MASTFSKGDVVQLKSGGPKMTVEALVSDKKTAAVAFRMAGFADDDPICVWFVGSELKRECLKSETLTKADTKTV